jgi:hypothetical protein
MLARRPREIGTQSTTSPSANNDKLSHFFIFRDETNSSIRQRRPFHTKTEEKTHFWASDRCRSFFENGQKKVDLTLIRARRCACFPAGRFPKDPGPRAVPTR